MKKLLLLSFMLCIALVATGCSSLAVMKPAVKVDEVPDGKGLVNIVRPSVFFGDGIKYEAWDGTTFIGTLEAGTMIQYVAEPGEHVFMVDPTNLPKWGRIILQVEPGETYYLKPNQIPFAGLILGIADADDERIPVWLESLTPVAIDQNKSKPVPQAYIDNAKREMKAAKH